MFNWLRRLFAGSAKSASPTNAKQQTLRPVPGAMTASREGKVIYNLLTPHMQQFLGRCVGALKKSGIKAKGTGQFSVLLIDKPVEIMLDKFYQPTDDPALVDQVVQEAIRRIN